MLGQLEAFSRTPQSDQRRPYADEGDGGTSKVGVTLLNGVISPN